MQETCALSNRYTHVVHDFATTGFDSKCMSCVRISAFLHVFYVSFVIFSCRFVCMCAHMRVSLRVYVQCARVCV